MAKVAIVGAGIIGLAHAYLAARAGHEVLVFDRSPAACGASIRNFGMVWPIGQPPGRLHDLALRSRELWLEILSEAGLPYHASGSLHAAYRTDEANVAREFSELGPTLGYECEWLDAAQTLSKTTALRKAGLLGALWSPGELTVDPPLTIATLPLFLSERYNVKFSFNTAVLEIETGALRTALGKQAADLVLWAGGDDFQTLWPEFFNQSGLTRCKLQMLRTVGQPEGWSLGPSLAFGLTFRHYPTFAVCTTLSTLKERVAHETPAFDRYGIHVMASEDSRRRVTLGDSHEYGQAVTIFDQAEVNRLIVEYAQNFLRLPAFSIEETWHGVYAKHAEQPYMRWSPAPDVHAVTVTSGIGMTLSFGLAENTWRDV